MYHRPFIDDLKVKISEIQDNINSLEHINQVEVKELKDVLDLLKSDIGLEDLIHLLSQNSTWSSLNSDFVSDLVDILEMSRIAEPTKKLKEIKMKDEDAEVVRDACIGIVETHIEAKQAEVQTITDGLKSEIVVINDKVLN